MSPEQHLLDHLAAAGTEVRLLDHPPCRTSVESAAARAAAGAPDAVGAKALVVSTKSGFAMLVLPGMHRLDSKRARDAIGKFRFARPEEVAEATGGLEIGTIPPFARPVFPGIERLIVDAEIAACAEIGFNAACLTRSAVMPSRHYLALAMPDSIEPISCPPDQEES